jgi:PIN domain nuclease of toxin-antitoxin system
VRYLIDTNILIWALDTPERLRPHVAREIAEPANDVLVSTISVVEMCIKSNIGKLKIPSQLSEKIVGYGFDFLPLMDFHAHPLATLPLHHRDPFDRMLIVQALTEGLTLITADDKFLEYSVPVLIN